MATPPGTVALERDLLVGRPFELARALLDGSLDVVGGHVGRLRVVEDAAQPRVRGRITATDSGRDGDLADELREELAALGVDGALLVLDRMPLGVSRHTVLLLLRFSEPESSTEGDPASADKEKAPTPEGIGASRGMRKNPGNVLLSHQVTLAVPSALEGLTAVFGMGTGVTPPLWSPG